MLMNPTGGLHALTREAAAEISKRWWILFLSGAIAAVAGMIVLSIKWTVADLAVFVGFYLIFRGIFTGASPTIDNSSVPVNLVVGVAQAIAGIVVLAWPGPTLLVIAIFIGASIVVAGIFNVAGAISNHDQIRYWWVILVLGLVELGLGIYLLRRPGLTLAVAITAIGIWAILVGALQIALAFEIKDLPKLLDDLERRGDIPSKA
jgi:uncharacterized membrane protein HdeD (DUF308 family)